ncbi:hypothetical protein COEREDRAFT_80845 [Coemansia reversa NRRL 1564]|uniref:G-protein coupled receptors family 1 profile domain-containing protein n=1 Tax=Coemansia reversa (strain ATCC 12441 / NRRL 1564) TaxID=763665 RepID=A0A2G5BDR4_COERN|nr:hypothetical protein COEREDRAFT_80845 [Coemansia reversa NRRL 1564]|eukprot:PIA17158.1 hypothetical protein COEREDRAFT_80845 [Coemansia reversa NRRL 1564]
MDDTMISIDVSDIQSILQSISEPKDTWGFVVSSEWITAIQTLACLSLISSVAVICTISWIIRRHRKYLDRLSLHISGYVALADMLNSLTQILMLHDDLMMSQNSHGLRFISWLSMFSTLLFVFLTLSISLQLHLSTLTNVRVGVYMRLEKYYVPASITLATILPAIAVSQMHGLKWVPLMHTFDWPMSLSQRRVILWMCNYVWIAITIVYCAGVAGLLSLRIRRMWKDSVEVVATPRMPEKWDWARLTASVRPSNETAAFSITDTLSTTEAGATLPEHILFTPQPSLGPTSGTNTLSGRGYLVTLLGSDEHSGRVVAIQSHVDKRRFLRSVQRLACYPMVPVISQLGVVAMNMTAAPKKGLYIYGSAMASTSGLLNLAVFLLNPALPDILKEYFSCQN